MTDVPQSPSDEERTTDENEPAAAPPSPPSAPFSSSTPADESPAAAATPASTAPVTDVTTPDAAKVDEDTDADADEGEDEEPLEATRLSPYAVASFAVGMLALFQAPTSIFTQGAQPIPTSQLLRFLLPTMLLPVIAGGVSLWLSFRAEEEIFVAGGRFGGVGLYRAARVIAIATLLIVVAVFVVLFFLAEQPQPQPNLGQFG